MKTARVKIKCTMCGKFEVEFYADTNEHGFFSIPDGYCPECFSLLIQVIDGGIKGIKGINDAK